MIWTQHQADLISEIYSLLEAPSSPKLEQASTADRHQTHKRNASDASASSDEDSPRLQKSSSVLKSLVGASDITDTAFFLGGYGKTEMDFSNLSQGSLKRSDAKSLRTTSAIFVGDRQETAEEHTSITPPRRRRNSAMRRILPPSLLPRSGGSLNSDLK